MKKVHKALHLRHHKHTGKLLAHKHTSYRVLFLLMFVPVIALALVERLDVAASDLSVSASVPAAMPSSGPVITSPKDGQNVVIRKIDVTGTCPIISPAIVVAIYNNDALAGSASCTSSGTFSVPVTLSYGENSLVPKVVTITGEVGAVGPTVMVIFPTPLYGSGLSNVKPVSGVSVMNPPLHIVSDEIYALITPDGKTTWHGRIAGGQVPYQVKIDWGDGNVDKLTVNDSSEQAFMHQYDVIRSYSIAIDVTDAAHETMTFQIAGVTRYIQMGITSLDTSVSQLPPVVTFVQKYAVQIYIAALSGLVFLWYLEHGRHIVMQATVHHRPRRYRH